VLLSGPQHARPARAAAHATSPPAPRQAILGESLPAILYGAGPRTVLESHAKRADERLSLEDLRKATKVVARALCDLLAH
jgi:acetylornithine deacetylase/succinyl-diaminopimelate desuccinylase-like protein